MHVRESIMRRYSKGEIVILRDDITRESMSMVGLHTNVHGRECRIRRYETVEQHDRLGIACGIYHVTVVHGESWWWIPETWIKGSPCMFGGMP